MEKAVEKKIMANKIYPEYPCFVKDFLTSRKCKRMSMADFGIFNWMLMHAWNNTEHPAHLPNDIDDIAWELRIDKQLISDHILKWGKWVETEDKKFLYNPKQLSLYESLLTKSQVLANNRLGKGKKQTINKRKTDEQPSGNGNGTDNGIVIKHIIAFLNEEIGTKYRSASKTITKHINARLAEKFTLEDFKTVIRKKNTEWAKDDKMSKYLRPKTLFGTNFESYLNQKAAEPKFDYEKGTEGKYGHLG